MQHTLQRTFENDHEKFIVHTCNLEPASICHDVGIIDSVQSIFSNDHEVDWRLNYGTFKAGDKVLMHKHNQKWIITDEYSCKLRLWLKMVDEIEFCEDLHADEIEFSEADELSADEFEAGICDDFSDQSQILFLPN